MRIIYVDDERPARDNFRLTAASFPEISSLTLFESGAEALEWAKTHRIDAAFLDMEMPELHGLELARSLKALNPDIHVIFVTAYSQYAMDAWGVDATGYLLKPYASSEIRKALSKCRSQSGPSHRVCITTIPDLSITVDGRPLRIAGGKPRELLALLIDRGSRGVTAGEGIACLWPDKPNDASAQSLYRMTYKRLSTALTDAGVGHIVESRDNRRFLVVDQVECDLYRILAGDHEAGRQFSGQYLREYSWAEDRCGQLHRMLLQD
ncbi:MAG: response regulator [Oscillospiraceae bacterium]|nr:response regulator [Oscillospiraceae bacterium]